MGRARYYANGFIPISNPPARIHRLAATVTIVKGDALFDDGSGYATNANTDFAATFLGIAAAGVVGNSSNVYVEIYPPTDDTLYIVPVAASALITQTAAGTYCDLENNDDIDISDNITEGWAFFIEEIDVSAAAIVANTYGYAIGRLRSVGTQA